MKKWLEVINEKHSIYINVCIKCGHCKSRYLFHVKQEKRMERLIYISMGKIFILIIDEETVLDDLLSYLKKRRNVKLMCAFPEKNILQYDSLKIDPKYRTVTLDGTKIELTQYEFEILYLLAKHPGQVFSKENIYEQVWKEPVFGGESAVVSLIYRIRKKVEPDPKRPIYILTVWGIGYKFNDALDSKNG